MTKGGKLRGRTRHGDDYSPPIDIWFLSICSDKGDNLVEMVYSIRIT